jgi:hypothetical protein
MASVSSERIAVGGGNDDEQQRLLPFLLFIFIYFLFSSNPLPSSIPPPLNPHHRQVDDCVACDEEVLIEGVLDVEKSTINQQRGQANAEDRLGRRGRKGSGKATRG